MKASEYYKRLFAYNKKVLYSYFKVIENIPWTRVSRNMESSHYSIKETLIHILTVYNGWLNYNVYGKSSEIPFDTEHNPENYHSMKEIQKFKEKVWSGVEALLEKLDEKMLRRKISAPWLPGKHSLEDVLMQVTLEQAHHLGEIIALLWRLDIEPPEMTWIMNTGRRKG